MADITLTVDREARDVLRAYLNFSLPFEELDSTVYEYNERRGLELTTRAMLVFSLLEDLGWEQHGRLDRYTIALSREELLDWVSECKASAEEVVESERDHLTHIELGEFDRYYIGHSQEVSAEITKRDIIKGALELAILSRVLDDLNATAVA